MSNLETDPKSISSSNIESILFGGDFEQLKRQIDQSLSQSLTQERESGSSLAELILGTSALKGPAGSKRDKGRWIIVDSVQGPLIIDRTQLAPWQEAWYRANQYREQNDWPNAIAAIHEAINLQPNPSLVWALYTMLGLFYSRARDYERAVFYLGKAIRLHPSDGLTQSTLGSAYLMLYLINGDQNKLKRAVKPLRAAIRLRYNQAHNQFYLGLVHHYLSEWQNAEANYRKAIELQNDLEVAYLYLARLYLHLAQRNKHKRETFYRKAIEIFRQLAEAQPKNSQAYNYIGFLYHELDDLEASAREFEKAVEVNNNNFLALANLGRAYLELGRFKDARHTFSQIIGSPRRDIGATLANDLEWPREYVSKGVDFFLSEALTCYGVASIELHNCQTGAVGEEQDNLREPKLVREAKSAFKKAIELNPENNYAHYDLAALYYQLDQPEKAQEAIRRALDINPRDETIRRNMNALIEEQLKIKLHEDGLLKRINGPILDLRPYQNRRPVVMQGKSLSETVVEERR